ncbi:MAG TPA: Sec-independent protein translocase protein TatB [Luteimonas sp.]|nr:Sec-independent protein translocase protein TatB [Luteimonas sp.]HRO27252.1 Sec-independent protein translocase protein TatB [Luteimonas sp.]HRP72443.1 Sec-independent protein translocase protein TatB [Luteimonas sp.]
MFDIGFTELLLIAVVALIVLGPERLPKAARFAGLWVRRARAQWYSVKSELERELAADELKRSLHDAKQAAADLQKTMQETEAEVQAKVREAEDGTRREIEGLRRQTMDGIAPDAEAPVPEPEATPLAQEDAPAQLPDQTPPQTDAASGDDEAPHQPDLLGDPDANGHDGRQR